MFAIRKSKTNFSLISAAVFVTIFSNFASDVQSLRILGVFPHFGKSHFDVFQPFMVALSQRGHEVTVLGNFPLKEKIPRYTDLHLDILESRGTDLLEMRLFEYPIMVKYLGVNMLRTFALDTCSRALNSNTFRTFLNSKGLHYDLIITEFFNTNCLLIPLVEKFQVPFVGFTSHILMPWHETWIGNLNSPASTPVIFLGNGDKLSFLRRVENFLVNAYAQLFFKYVIERDEKELLKKYLGRDDLPYSSEIMQNISLILANTQFSLNRPKPLSPNVIEIAGIHIGENKKLPSNIEKWINESTHGVIYFSLGSLIKGHTFPEEKRQMFMKAFARLPQRVLWKWETEMPGKPDNVMTQGWMPQFDILSHSNVKAFISHGGLLGTTEAVHNGVPMVIMPQFGDQFANARAVELSGGGIMLDFTAITEDIIYDALTKVLTPDFNKKAKELSERFRDRPLPPLETAIYWVEYVARHKGAPHMRTAAVGMPLYQYLLLDVIAFLMVISAIILYVSYVVLKFFLKRLFGRKREDKLKKN